MALVPVSKGENLPFESLCNCFEELCKPTNDRHHRERLVRKLWDNFAIKEEPSFPLFRLMLPHLDTSSRPNYKLKQKKLADLYVDIMGMDKNSTDARTITEWKRPSSGLQRSEQGNFPEVMYSVLKKRCKPRADLRRVTVGEVNAMLDCLATEDEKRPPMQAIHIRCTALEQKWLLRVITKDLAIGLKEDKIFKMLHPDAQELYNSVCDLKQTCERCADPKYRLESISLELFTPVRPRLAARANWRNVDKEMRRKEGKYVAEYKLDGERLLMHFGRSPSYEGGRQTQWFTRNSKTCSYGGVMQPIVDRCVPAGVESVVLDGELMVYDRDTGDFAPFGVNRSMGAGLLEGNKQPCFVVFDLLWLNGRNLTQQSLAERRKALEGLISWEEHSFELAAQHEVTGGTDEMMRWLDNAMLHGYEGVMLKALNSPYVPGSRDNDWQKLKPDYVDEMGETLDLLIVAGYYGEVGPNPNPNPNPNYLLIVAGYYGEGKKRGGDISHFLMGLRAPPEEKNRYKSEHPLFYPFCKVGTGYTQNRLAQLRDDLQAGRETWHETAPPAHLCGWKHNKTDDKPDVWYHPAKSLLMTVKAYEITTSGAFLPCGITLRFPRSTAIREPHDKSWEEAESYRRVKEIFDECKGRLASCKRRAADVAQADTGDASAQRGGRKVGPPKRPKVLTSVPMHLGLAQGLSKVVALDDLEGPGFQVDETHALPKVVAITSSDGAHSGQQPGVQISIKELGGEVRSGDPLKMKDLTHFVVCGDGDCSARNMISHARLKGDCHFDIVRHTWVLDCHQARRRLPLEPKYVLLATEAARRRMELTMDPWGDRYETLADSASLQSALHLVREAPRDGAPPAVDDQLRALEHWEQVGLRTPLSVLRDVTAYSPAAAVRLRLRLLGAAVVPEPMAHVTHAVLAGGALADGTADALLAKLRALRSAAPADYYQVRLVNEGWLAACEAQGKWVAEEPYRLRRPQIAHAEASSSRL